MTDRVAHILARLLVIGMLINLGVIGYVFYSSYQGRVNVVKAQRAGCERSKLDRAANASGWRHAQSARNASGDFEVAKFYGRIADGLEQRSRVACDEVFPRATLFP